MPRITKAERTPAQPNCLVDDQGRAYQLEPVFPVKFRIAVRVADALLARAQWRAERLPSAEAMHHYCEAAELGAQPPYAAMDGIPRMPLVRL